MIGDSFKLLPLSLIILEEAKVLDPGSARSGTGFHDYTGGVLAKYRSRYPRVRVKALRLQAEK